LRATAGASNLEVRATKAPRRVNAPLGSLAIACCCKPYLAGLVVYVDGKRSKNCETEERRVDAKVGGVEVRPRGAGDS
jgi:hypothetical protein